MLRITAIEAQRRNPNRVNLHLDGQFAFGLSRIVAAWLSVGQELDEEKISALKAEDAKEEAFQKACNFLSYRPRSVNEVRKNLEKHEMPAEAIDLTITRLQELNYLGDADFAKAWVENRNAFRPRSKRALRVELLQKGVENEVIETVLDECVQEEPLALLAAQKYAHRLERHAWPEFRQKLGAFLVRRGFSYDVIASVTRQVWQKTHPTQTNENEYEG